MKKVFNSLFVIIAAMVTFAGCAKQEVDAPATPETKTVQFFANSIETKTTFDDLTDGKYPTLWSEGDEVRFFLNLDVKADTDKKAVVECSNDHKSARFEATFADPGLEDPDYTYTFYAISPESAYVNNGKNAKEGRITVTIPETQQPLPSTVDPLAQILYAASGTTDDMPSSVEFKFHHLTAYGRFTLLNLENGDSPVSKVKIEAPEGVYLTGKWNYFVASDPIVDVKEGINTLTINTKNTSDIWFACAPVDIANKTLKFTVTTEAGSFVRDVPFPGNAKFESGKIARFSVDMAGIKVEEQPGETTEAWTLVTDASTLAVEDNVIIAAKDSDFAISTTQNKNNRGQAAIIRDGNTLVNLSDDVQILTLTDGTADGTFGFYTGTQYLYAASSSSNYLKSQDSNNANGSWKVTIAEDGTATVVAQGTNTRNTMQYNQSSSLFACYGSASQKAIVIYKLISSNEGGETPEQPDTTPKLEASVSEVELDADQTTDTIELTIDNLEDVEVNVYSDEACTTLDNSWLTASLVGNTVSYTAIANESEESRTAYIQIYAFDLQAKEFTVVIPVTQAGKVVIDNTFESGDYWIVETTAKLAMMPITGDYGYPTANLAEAVGESYKSFEANIFTIAYNNDDECYTIKDSNDKYLYMNTKNDGSWYTSFNVSTSYVSDTKYQWSISINDEGKHIITNLASNYTIAYSATHKSWGAYEDVSTNALPVLVKADNPLAVELTSISVSGHKTLFTEGEEFEFGGTVEAKYNDNSTKDVTTSASVTKPEMVDGAEVTVSYTDGVTKIFKYNITVKPESQGGDEGGVVEGGSDDFHTISNTNTSYVTGKTTAGWNYKNCAIFKGGTSDSSPAFKMIGDASNRALCMNGKTSAVGSITSPTLTTGCGTLKFNYGLPFGDTKIKFRVDIMQDGAVVKTFTIDKASATKLTKYSHEEAINVAGDFQIVFTNLSPSNSTSNKDRTAIWDVEWTGYQN